ncbi:antibiotic biosynthesis monooxygenase [Flavobacterium sp. xlx-214]|uniref:putative quinol monooxygenase n=1 Tax=unclassified Flavobacterium TaxID=196869 RepID=UPI0013D4E5E7|nr:MULTISPECIES: antibiotic biosynthesis monooxygenase family protein [unclassified Flavobacterium]MBA5793397.1 antibiotic biosynthesis monooxygenase [Flavobacterium sp. xlx-221]QMI84043.1 antibiotic biosynthesis monooxygenase [Flavobacterium sp. xlx-214]
MRYVVIVSYRVFPQQREAFFNLVRKEADALVQNELGTLHVTSMMDQIDPNKFLNLKIFESKEAYEEHKKGSILKAFLQEADEMILEGPQVIFEGVHMYSCDDYTLEQKSGEDMSAYFRR